MTRTAASGGANQRPGSKVIWCLLSRYWTWILLIASWEIWVDLSGFNSIVLPRPGSVASDVIGHIGTYLQAGAVTMAVAVAGLVTGLLAGTGVAILAWSTPVLSGMLTPLTLIFTSVPVVTVIPIIARMLGYDMHTEIAIVGIISFFPAFVFGSAGLRALPAGSSDLFSVLGAGRWHRLFWLALPAALPNWMIGFRIAAPQAILAAMLAEFLMGTSGLGYLFIDAKAGFDMDRAFGTGLVATLASVLSFAAAATAEKAVREHWA